MLFTLVFKLFFCFFGIGRFPCSVLEYFSAIRISIFRSSILESILPKPYCFRDEKRRDRHQDCKNSSFIHASQTENALLNKFRELRVNEHVLPGTSLARICFLPFQERRLILAFACHAGRGHTAPLSKRTEGLNIHSYL